MKRILALLCVIACLCCLCVPAFAANDTVTIHAYAPSDWSDVRLWIWDDNDQNPDTAGGWPGNFVMTKGDDGWYSVEIPAGYPNMLVNGNNGGVQTGDIKGVDITKEVWIVVNNDKTTQVFDAKPDDVVLPGDAPVEPAVLESLALVGDGIPGVGTWIVEDAAGDMTKVSDTVYTKEIALTAGTTMQFKVAGNDSWDSGYNFGGSEDPTPVTVGTALDMIGGAESKNLTLTVDKDCTLKFTVTLKDGAASLLVEEVAGSAGGEAVKPSEPAETKPVETKPAETKPAETKPAETQPAGNAGNNEVKATDNTALFAIIGSVVVIAIAAVVFIILKKKQ